MDLPLCSVAELIKSREAYAACGARRSNIGLPD